MSDYSKQKRAFLRKLLLAHLIDTQTCNVPMLQKTTGMPRRTIQDCIKTMDDIGIKVEFIPKAGARHNDGQYQISDWGPIDNNWVRAHVDYMREALDLKTPDAPENFAAMHQVPPPTAASHGLGATELRHN